MGRLRVHPVVFARSTCDEAIDAPATALGEALDEAKLPREKFTVLKPGQVFEV